MFSMNTEDPRIRGGAHSSVTTRPTGVSRGVNRPGPRENINTDGVLW